MSKLIQKAKKCFAVCAMPNNSTLCSSSADETNLLSEQPRNSKANASPVERIIHNELIYQISTTPIKISRESNLKKQVAKANLQAQFSSELVESDQSQLEISQFPMLMVTPEKPKSKILTSTLVYDNVDFSQNEFTLYDSPSLTQIDEEKEEEYVPKAFSNMLYESPVNGNTFQSSLMTMDWSTQSRYLAMDITEDNSCDVQSHGFNSDDFATAHSDMFMSVASESVAEIVDLYACCVSYEAMSRNELTVDFSERLRLVQSDSNHHLCLVQNIQTGVYGFVPKYCILPISMFLRELQRSRKF
jgi:hypothetical protein